MCIQWLFKLLFNMIYIVHKHTALHTHTHATHRERYTPQRSHVLYNCKMYGQHFCRKSSTIARFGTINYAYSLALCGKRKRCECLESRRPLLNRPLGLGESHMARLKDGLEAPSFDKLQSFSVQATRCVWGQAFWNCFFHFQNKANGLANTSRTTYVWVSCHSLNAIAICHV